MGNVYGYTECDHCGKVTDNEYRFIVHSDPTPIDTLAEKGYPAGQIAGHFCGYCGGYVDIMKQEVLTPATCHCGNFQYQGWNYEDDNDKKKWKEVDTWWEKDDRDD